MILLPRDDRRIILGRRGSAAAIPFSSVVFQVINENGADTTTTFDDQSNSNHTVTAAGNIQWDTDQAPVGLTSSALLDGANDRLASPVAHADFGWGTGDWTAEAFGRSTDITIARSIFKLANANYSVFINSDGSLRYWNNTSAVIISAAAAISINTWYHIALCKRLGNTRLFIDGGQVGLTYADSINYGAAGQIIVGEGGGADDWIGWIAAARFTKGVARYTANFTPPTLPYPTV